MIPRLGEEVLGSNPRSHIYRNTYDSGAFFLSCNMGQVERFVTTEQYLEYLADRKDCSLEEVRTAYYNESSIFYNDK